MIIGIAREDPKTGQANRYGRREPKAKEKAQFTALLIYHLNRQWRVAEPEASFAICYSLFADFSAVVAEPAFGAAEVRMKSVRARRVKLQEAKPSPVTLPRKLYSSTFTRSKHGSNDIPLSEAHQFWPLTRNVPGGRLT